MLLADQTNTKASLTRCPPEWNGGTINFSRVPLIMDLGAPWDATERLVAFTTPLSSTLLNYYRYGLTMNDDTLNGLAQVTIHITGTRNMSYARESTNSLKTAMGRMMEPMTEVTTRVPAYPLILLANSYTAPTQSEWASNNVRNNQNHSGSLVPAMAGPAASLLK